MQLLIRGETWSVVFLSEKEATRRLEPEELALADIEKRRLVFTQRSVSDSTVRHELFHAYCATLYTNSARLNNTQFEEQIADLVGEWAPMMEKQRRAVSRWIKRQRLR